MIFPILDEHYNLRRRRKAAPFFPLVFRSAPHSLMYNMSANMVQKLIPWTQRKGANRAFSANMPTLGLVTAPRATCETMDEFRNLDCEPDTKEK